MEGFSYNLLMDSTNTLNNLITAARTRLASEGHGARYTAKMDDALDYVAGALTGGDSDLHWTAFEVAAGCDSDLSDYIRVTYLPGF